MLKSFLLVAPGKPGMHVKAIVNSLLLNQIKKTNIT